MRVSNSPSDVECCSPIQKYMGFNSSENVTEIGAPLSGKPYRNSVQESVKYLFHLRKFGKELLPFANIRTIHGG